MTFNNDMIPKKNSLGRFLISDTSADNVNTRLISVLYLDDDPELINLICMYLEKTGEMMVDTSGSVEEAMNKMRYISYDVIVTDYTAKGNNGNELLRNVRAKGERIPFVYFVVFRNTQYDDEAKQFRQVSVIEKMGNSGANLSKLRQAILDSVKENRINTIVHTKQYGVRPDGSAKS